MRLILLLVGIVFTPFFWLAFNLCGANITLVEFYKDLFNHYKSGEHFGAFDD